MLFVCSCQHVLSNPFFFLICGNLTSWSLENGNTVTPDVENALPFPIMRKV